MSNWYIILKNILQTKRKLLLTNLYVFNVYTGLSAISCACAFKEPKDYIVSNAIECDIKFSFVKLIILLTEERIIQKRKSTYIHPKLKLAINSKSDDKIEPFHRNWSIMVWVWERCVRNRGFDLNRTLIEHEPSGSSAFPFNRNRSFASISKY